MRSLAASLVIFLLWNLIVGAFLLLADPWIGLPTALGFAALLLWGFLLQPLGRESGPHRWATLRLRPLDGPALRWTLIAIPVLLLVGWSLGDVYTRLVPVPPASLDPFAPVMRTTGGRLTIAVFAIGVAPVVEEFVFRGLVQRVLERRLGTTAGIAGAAALFALVHFLPWIFPLHFVLGVAFGFAVYATKSIWAGVILHAANNAAALAGVELSRGAPETTGSVWEIGLTADLWISLCALVVASIASFYVARRLLAAGRGLRLRGF